MNCVGDGRFQHVSYGLRLDGTIGRATPGNPVAEAIVVSQGHVNESEPLRYAWSDGTLGPVKRPGTVMEVR